LSVVVVLSGRMTVLQFRVKLGCPLKTGEYRIRVYHFKPDDKKVVPSGIKSVVCLSFKPCCYIWPCARAAHLYCIAIL